MGWKALARAEQCRLLVANELHSRDWERQDLPSRWLKTGTPLLECDSTFSAVLTPPTLWPQMQWSSSGDRAGASRTSKSCLEIGRTSLFSCTSQALPWRWYSEVYSGLAFLSKNSQDESDAYCSVSEISTPTGLEALVGTGKELMATAKDCNGKTA
ncbi:hypothetical protein BC567DRAFT_234831 [Phyllosticta citribraziliensis]